MLGIQVSAMMLCCRQFQTQTLKVLRQCTLPSLDQHCIPGLRTRVQYMRTMTLDKPQYQSASIARSIDSLSSKPVTHLKLDRIVVVALRSKGLVGVIDICLVLVTADDRLHFTPNLHQVLGVPENHSQQ